MVGGTVVKCKNIKRSNFGYLDDKHDLQHEANTFIKSIKNYAIYRAILSFGIKLSTKIGK